jgi:hypothetical protein
MWKPEHRRAADRSGLGYPSDLTGAEWAEALICGPCDSARSSAGPICRLKLMAQFIKPTWL